MGPRAKLIARIAPVAPPCFETRLQWIAYLQSAAEAGKPTNGRTDVVLIGPPGEQAVNPHFAFCRDCAAQHHLAMSRVGKCQPDWLKQQNQDAPTALTQEST
jgi:hypothetical protein